MKMLRFATSRVACLSKSAIAPIRGEFCPRPFGAFVVGQHRFHTETSSTLQQLLTTPELNLSAEKKDRYSKALVSNKYLTVEDLHRKGASSAFQGGILLPAQRCILGVARKRGLNTADEQNT